VTRSAWQILESYLREQDDGEDVALSANPFEPRARATASAATRPVGSTSVTQTARAPSGLPNPDPKGAPRPAPTDKPKYRGSFVGQVASAGSQGVNKRVSWQNKAGEWRGRTMNVQQANDSWVWDGSDWVKPGAFAAKFPKRK
jgi:hypothetical protein